MVDSLDHGKADSQSPSNFRRGAVRLACRDSLARREIDAERVHFLKKGNREGSTKWRRTGERASLDKKRASERTIASP